MSRSACSAPRPDRPAGAGALAGTAAVLIATIGLVTLGEYVRPSFDPGLDDWLFSRALAAANPTRPGRMSPAAATAFVLIGASLALMETSRRRLQWLRLAMAAGVGLIGLLGMQLYLLFQVAAPRTVWPFSTMAVHTTALFGIVGLSLALLRPHTGFVALLARSGAGGALARGLIPVTVVLPIVLGWLLLRLEQAQLIGHELLLATFSTSSIVLFTSVVWGPARRLDRLEAQRLGALPRSPGRTRLRRLFDPEGQTRGSIELDVEAVFEHIHSEDRHPSIRR